MAIKIRRIWRDFLVMTKSHHVTWLLLFHEMRTYDLSKASSQSCVRGHPLDISNCGQTCVKVITKNADTVKVRIIV